jgi:chaperonin GroES
VAEVIEAVRRWWRQEVKRRKKGDRVITSKYAGTEIKLDGEELTIVRQSDILAVVE